jgi:hypothetical protein
MLKLTQLQPSGYRLFCESRSPTSKAQQANAKASPIGLGTLRSEGGGCANWLIRESDVMKIHQKTPELENRTEPSSRPEFRQNLQPSCLSLRLKIEMEICLNSWSWCSWVLLRPLPQTSFGQFLLKDSFYYPEAFSCFPFDALDGKINRQLDEVLGPHY